MYYEIQEIYKVVGKKADTKITQHYQHKDQAEKCYEEFKITFGNKNAYLEVIPMCFY